AVCPSMLPDLSSATVSERYTRSAKTDALQFFSRGLIRCISIVFRAPFDVSGDRPVAPTAVVAIADPKSAVFAHTISCAADTCNRRAKQTPHRTAFPPVATRWGDCLRRTHT